MSDLRDLSDPSDPGPPPGVDDLDAAGHNRAHWDALAAVHGEGTDNYYDVEALVSGKSSLGTEEERGLTDALGADGVSGRDVLHVQCHIGFDSITLARRGARVTGVDLSPASLAKARAITERCGVEVEFVEADSTALPESLHGRFDLAYATIGVICWIVDIDSWMRSVAACLRPGGSLVLVDLHPLYCMLETADPLAADFPYAFAGPFVANDDGSYANLDAHLAATKSVQAAHSLGETVTAAIDAGLVVTSLREHLDTSIDPRGYLLRRDEDGRFRLRLTGHPLPLLFGLVARSPG